MRRQPSRLEKVLLYAGERHYRAQLYEVGTSNVRVASRMIVRTLYKQMRMRSVPVFHGPHRGFTIECRLG